jgi:asparagine synthase (glutamine-hydrolysing)
VCGIAGIVCLGGDPRPLPAALSAMCETLVHRGPDEEGREIREGVALGMRRLSIIDLAGGSQPVANEDGSVRVVFNGEIYNFRELRKDLEARGHSFVTRSDTEVLVHAYEEHGPRFPELLNGMFAFALHDVRRRKLLLVRDHLGIKPLFYAITPEYLVFGSEVKALLASGLVERELCVDSLAQFLAWEYVPGSRTLLQGVCKLEAGQLLEVDMDRPFQCPTPRCYWDVPRTGEDMALRTTDWVDAIDAKLNECVRRQLVSDVPLGAFLSGGIDSSLVVAAMGKTTTFSIGFDDPSYNELSWSERVARHLGVDHQTELIRPNVVELFEFLMRFMDDPIGDFSIFPTYLVSRLARQKVKVVLSGDGGDELFAGYETYLAERRGRAWTRLPRWLRRGALEPLLRAVPPREAKKGLVNKAKRFAEGAAHPDELSHARWRLFLGDAARDALLTPDARRQVETPTGGHIVDLFERAGTRQPLNRSLYVDLKSYLVDNVLVKVDRMSMAASLESRVPYLDRELVELAFLVPESEKLQRGRTKAILKRVAERHLPAECVHRPKEGFSIPMKNWLDSDFRPLMEDYLDASQLRREGLFDPAEVSRLKSEHLAGRANHSHVIWGMMVFQAWRRMWLKG